MNKEDNLAKSLGLPVHIGQMPINGHTINYCVAGKGPPILLIHGANFGWGVWYPNIAELAKRFTVYAIDLPGAGRSTRIDYAKMDPEKDLLVVVEKFVDNLELQNFDIIGCSIGGWIALQLALRKPDRVNRIIIENGVGFADFMGISDKIIGFYPLAKLVSKTLINPANKKRVEKFLRGTFYYKNLSLSKEFLEYFLETMETSHGLLLISRLTSLHSQLNLEKKLPIITHKTLVIWGRDDKIMPLKKNARNFKLLSKATIKIISNTGHTPSLENPQEFNRLVNDFLVNYE